MNKVSVLMAAYNHEAYIREAIESVIMQSYQDWEMIVVNDGSTDRTGDIARQYEPRIIYIEQANRGCPSALNRAFHDSKGKYVVVLPSDDYFLPYALARLVEFMEGHNDVDIVYTDGIVIDSSGKHLGLLSEYRPVPRYTSLLDSVVVSNWVSLAGCAMLRREALERLEGPYDEKMVGYEDWELATRLSASGCRLEQLHLPTFFYRVHQNNKSSPSSTFAQGRREAFIYAHFKILNADFFKCVSVNAQVEFLKNLLLSHLSGEAELQEEVINLEAFSGLDEIDRSSILYYLGMNNLLDENFPELGRFRLDQSLKLNPANIKTRLVIMLLIFGTDPIKWARSITRFFRAMINKAEIKTKSLPVGTS